MVIFNCLRIGLLIVLLIPLFGTTSAFASEHIQKQVRVLIIFDVSRSMMTQYESGTRMEAAKKMAYAIIDSLTSKPNVLVALRAYGSEKQYPPGDCKDSKLVFPFQQGNAAKIKAYIDGLKPTGITPIAYSLEQTVGDFTDTRTENFVIIITDGIEECRGNICQAAIKLSEKGIVLRPFIVGIGLTEEQSKEFDCVGNYFKVEKEITFSRLSNIIITQILNPTSAQVNLLDKKGQPTETNVPMIFYDLKDNLPEHSFIHTFDRKGSPDTLLLDVYRKYRIEIGTIPPVVIDTAKQLLGKHNIFAVDAAQGELKLLMRAATLGSEPLCRIKIHGQTKTLTYQKFSSTQKYLCGTYDLEIMTLPRILKDSVVITPEGKTIEIPASGQIQLSSKNKIIGTILVVNGKNQDWVCNLPPDGVFKYREFLQPGKYLLVYREKEEKAILNTHKKYFEIIARNFVMLDL